MSTTCSHQLRNAVPAAVVMFVLPIIMTAFFKPVYSEFRGAATASIKGSEVAIPGIAVTFVSCIVNLSAHLLINEHGWATWDRLRALRVGGADIAFGKAFAPWLFAFVDLLLLFALGWVIYDVDIESPVALLLTWAFFVAAVSLGMALVTLPSSVVQRTTATNILLLLFAGFGGALIQHAVLTSWGPNGRQGRIGP